MTEPKLSPEDSFREALKDLVAIAENLTTSCKTTEELIGVCQLAIENDGQLRLLMTAAIKKK